MAVDNNMRTNSITFRHGEETDIVIAKTKVQLEQSLLKEQYRQALDVLNGIIDGASYKSDNDTPVSNVVAFCGDRGEGKTSALMTIQNILLNSDCFAQAEAAKLFPEHKNISKDTFKVLKLVEPAFFDENHNLLELLIGQMYAEILRVDRETNSKYDGCSMAFSEDVAKRNHLMQHFQAVRSSLEIINMPTKHFAYDNLEEIDQLAVGIELKEKINELMRCYAKYFGKERVLISIDDLDLNISEGYRMAEEIRKYLSSPQVCIVMIAIKIEQLIEVVQSYLRKQIDRIVPDDTITEMAIRYVTKLLPLSQRIVMPTGESIVEKPLIIKINNSTESFASVKEAVVRLIYRKTRYIFVNGRNVSPIVPTNLRSMRHLLGLLCDMPDVTNTSGEEIIHNQTSFKNYFYHTWVRNLNNEDTKFVKELIKCEDLVAINKSVIMHIRTNILRPLNYTKELSPLFNAILNPYNTMQNISLGDVFYVLKYVDDTATSLDVRNLIFFLRAFYSIMLYDTYNIISSSETQLFVDKIDKEPSIYKYDAELQHLNIMQRLVNGSYFTYEQGEFLPDEKSTVARDKRIINGTTLIDYMHKVAKSQDTKLLQLCEFFVLTTRYPLNSSKRIEYDRTKTQRSYYANFTEKNHMIVFDVLAIFYNLINIKFTYQRWNEIFGGDFYDFALKNDDSLLKQILEKCYSQHKTPKSGMDDKLHSLISEAIIRFSEVQLAIVDQLTNNRETKEGNNAQNIRTLFTKIRQIGIKLYPLDDKEDRYEMKFHFLTPIIEFLNTIDESTFNKIFSSMPMIENLDEINNELDEIFADSLAKKTVRYPKTSEKVIKRLLKTDPYLYASCGGKNYWREVLGTNVEYQSWESVRAQLVPNIKHIRDIYSHMFELMEEDSSDYLEARRHDGV